MSVANLQVKDTADAKTQPDVAAEQRMFRRPSEWRIFWEAFSRDRLAVGAATVIALVCLVSLLAPVLSQPSLPLAVGRRRRAATGVSDADLARVTERAAAGVCLLGLRFSADRLVPPARFEALRRALGDRFVEVEIDSSKGNRFGIRPLAHSVLTLDLVDEPGHPTRDALERVLRFFDERLRG